MNNIEYNSIHRNADRQQYNPQPNFNHPYMDQFAVGALNNHAASNKSLADALDRLTASLDKAIAHFEKTAKENNNG